MMCSRFLAIWVVVSLVVATQATAIDKGALVIVSQQTELRVPSGKVADAMPGDALVVEQLKDKWLWVKPSDDGKPGWIDSAKVVAFETALEHFEQRIEKNKQDAAAFAGRAAILQRSFEWDKALEDYETAINLGLKTAKMYCTRGFLRVMREKVDDGLADLNEALRLDPKNVEALGYRGGVWEEKAQYDKALADYRKAMELEPSDPLNVTAVAMLQAACPDAKYRDGNQAVVLATKACQLTQWKSADAVGTLAAAYAETGNFAKAVEYGERALAVSHDPDKRELQERLALYKDKKPYRRQPEAK